MGTIRIASQQASPATTFYLEADLIQIDAPNRRWLVRFFLRAINGPGGSTASRYLGAGVQLGRTNGNEFGRHSGNPFLPGGLPNGATRWNDGPWDVWIGANSDGYWSGASTTYPLQMGLQYGNINTQLGGSIELPRIGTVPPPPNPLPTTPDQITATTMRYQFGSAGDGGANIVRWEYQYSTSPTFATGNSAVFASNGTSIVTDLMPSTTYYLRSRGVNTIGNGNWSAIRSGTTVAASAPGLLVSPALDGRSAQVALTPPPDMPNPSGYRLEYRLVGGTTTVVAVTTSPLVVSPLSPGATYEWRAAAQSGTYTGPFTAWGAYIQPNTNTNPGDFFDGSTPARADITYSWVAVSGSSMSRARAQNVRGWGIFASGSAVSGGQGAVYRVTGGRSQTFAARIDFWVDAVAPGFHAGIAFDAASAFPALQNAVYDGLIHVQLPARSQRLAAMFVWVNAAGVEVGRNVGPDVLVGANVTTWTPLQATGTPPPSAVRGALRVIDVAGPGWAVWRGGDSMLLDDAITPFTKYYFDGNTPDTAQWDYVWEGAVNASPSMRVASTTSGDSPLIDPDCPPVPAPPRPPAIPDSCIEDETTQWRRFWQEIPAIYVPVWIDTVPILRIHTATAVRLVRVRYYPNPFGRPLSDLESDSFCAEQIISFIPGDTIFTLDGVTERAWAEVAGSSNTLAADHLLRGDSSLWPLLGCGVGYYITVDVPTDTPANAVDIEYSLVQRYS